MKEEKIPTTTMLPLSLKRRLKEKAAAENRSVSGLMAELLAEALATKE